MLASDPLRAPLLVGDDAVQAREAVDAISRALVALAPVPSDPSLAVGTAGLMIAHAYLETIHPGRGHADLAGAAHQHAFRVVSSTPKSSPWLFQGLAGVAWAGEHLAADVGAITPVDQRMLAVVASDRSLPFEWMHGVGGLTAYATTRGRHGEELLRAVGARLVAAATRSEAGACWITEPRWAPSAFRSGPHVNLGFAHGHPGAMVGLARTIEAGVAPPEARALLADGSRWLLAQRIDADGGAWFATTTSDRVPSKTAWCYGDPGVAWALAVAGWVLRDDEILAQGVAVAKHAAARAPEETGIRDAAFCHGATGLAHVFHRLYRLSGEPELAAAARRWIGRALAMRRPDAPLAGFRSWAPEAPGTFGWKDDGGLLTGAAGIALVLVAALNPDAMSWDQPLMGFASG